MPNQTCGRVISYFFLIFPFFFSSFSSVSLDGLKGAKISRRKESVAVQMKAEHSISTSVPKGSAFTATQVRTWTVSSVKPHNNGLETHNKTRTLTGLGSWLRNWPYISFMAAKSSILARKTLTLIAFSKLEPACSNTALRLRNIWACKIDHC